MDKRPLNTILSEINDRIEELANRKIHIHDDNDPDWRLSKVEYIEAEDRVYFKAVEI